MGNDIYDLFPDLAESCYNLNFINLPLARLIHPFKFIPNGQKYSTPETTLFIPRRVIKYIIPFLSFNITF